MHCIEDVNVVAVNGARHASQRSKRASYINESGDIADILLYKQLSYIREQCRVGWDTEECVGPAIVHKCEVIETREIFGKLWKLGYCDVRKGENCCLWSNKSRERS